MNYFIFKTVNGVQPQAGYERVSIYRGTDTWTLWKTAKTVAEIRAEIIGDLFIIGDDLDTDVLANYPDLIDQKYARLRAEGASRLTAIAGVYVREERETWEEQKLQALAYLADNSADVPMLTQFATIRGVPIDVLANGILENNALFQTASGQVLGTMYALLDQVAAASDLNTALNVDWS